MTDSQHAPIARMYARLPSGEVLVPGKDCEGPDQYGACPAALAGEHPRCAGAVWRYGTDPAWEFQFRSESTVCPASILDPLGPLPVPLD